MKKKKGAKMNRMDLLYYVARQEAPVPIETAARDLKINPGDLRRFIVEDFEDGSHIICLPKTPGHDDYGVCFSTSDRLERVYRDLRKRALSELKRARIAKQRLQKMKRHEKQIGMFWQASANSKLAEFMLPRSIKEN